MESPDSPKVKPKARKKRAPAPAIKFPAVTGGMKTLANGTIQVVLSVDPQYTDKVMALLVIKNSGDSLDVLIKRVKAPKKKVEKDAEKKQNNQKAKRRRRYPYTRD